jgi:hypothetical protein
MVGVAAADPSDHTLEVPGGSMVSMVSMVRAAGLRGEATIL